MKTVALALHVGFATLGLWPAAIAAASPRSANALAEQALTAMGGEAVVRGLTALKLDIRQVVERIDDSERWERPAWIAVRTIDEVRDLTRGRRAITLHEDSPQFISDRTTIDDGAITATRLVSRDRPAVWQARPSDGVTAALAPEHILLTARAAPDLRDAGTAAIDGLPHDVLRFTWRGFPVTLYLDQTLHLLRRIESVRADKYDLVHTAWGDVRWRTDLLYWKRETSGLIYPRQSDLYRNGQHVQTDSIIALSCNPPLDDAAFVVPEAARQVFDTTGHQVYAARGSIDAKTAFLELADGIWLVKGNWNVVVADQGDGLLVIECPQSGGYSAKVLAAIAERFPGRPVKGLVTTTDALWHFAGLRTYVAQGLPIYALEPTVPLLKALVASPHTLEPDPLSRAPRAAIFHPITGPTTLGAAHRTIVVYPIRGHGDERMMMVWFPGQKLLYGSSNDVGPVGARRLGTFNLPELVAAVQREHLEVEHYVAIHTDKMAWADVQRTALTEPTMY
jgi:hypothetical protein